VRFDGSVAEYLATGVISVDGVSSILKDFKIYESPIGQAGI
jgi:hypothetical protein